jgi:regulator of sigma E protease
MTYVLAFLGFAALILLHEAGHFLAAKAVGMRVERFSLFFGPMLWKVKRGETEYGVATIPLGGYVKITGMNPHEEIPPEAVPRAYYNQPVWKRIVVILAGPAMNLLIALLIVTGIFWAQGNINATPLVTRTVAPGALIAPASSYLKGGDQIVSVDGTRGLSVTQITKQIATHRCAGKPVAGCQSTTPVTLVVRRDGKLHTFTLYPRYDATYKKMRVGFEFAEQFPPLGLFGAVGGGASDLWHWTTKTLGVFTRLFEPKDRKQIHSVVGGFEITQQAFAFSATDALGTLALISLSLAIINLFPFLPLDGGHVFWAVAEKVRGKRIPFEVMERSGVVGFALIMLVFVIGLSNDISTLSGSGFH